MAALDVLPLEKAKQYLNIPAERTQDDAELAEDFIPPAVERVERHLGRQLTDHASLTGSEKLAIKVVLGTYWRTQRVNMGRGATYGGAAGAAALEADSDPTGAAPLRFRLIDLLGEPADDRSTASVPQGCFPPPSVWPDPAGHRTVSWS